MVYIYISQIRYISNTLLVQYVLKPPYLYNIVIKNRIGKNVRGGARPVRPPLNPPWNCMLPLDSPHRGPVKLINIYQWTGWHHSKWSRQDPEKTRGEPELTPGHKTTWCFFFVCRIISPWNAWFFLLKETACIRCCCWWQFLAADWHACTSFTQNEGLFRVNSIVMTWSNGNISELLAICAVNSPVTGEFPSQRPVTWSFDVFFDLRLNKRLSKQSIRGDATHHLAHYDVTVMIQIVKYRSLQKSSNEHLHAIGCHILIRTI